MLRIEKEGKALFSAPFSSIPARMGLDAEALSGLLSTTTNYT
jgi:hypothetical protein